MDTAEDDSRELWNELCEDFDCEDTNYHATIDELLERIQRVSEDFDAIDEAEDIVLQAELNIDNENE